MLLADKAWLVVCESNLVLGGKEEGVCVARRSGWCCGVLLCFSGVLFSSLSLSLDPVTNFDSKPPSCPGRASSDSLSYLPPFAFPRPLSLLLPFIYPDCCQASLSPPLHLVSSTVVHFTSSSLLRPPTAPRIHLLINFKNIHHPLCLLPLPHPSLLTRMLLLLYVSPLVCV